MPPAAPPRKQEDSAACAGLLLIVCAVFWPWLVGGRALYWGDLGVYFQPLLAWERAQLLRGTLPLWNPDLFCGTPFFGNPQMWPLYPSTLALPFAPASRFLTVSCAGHVWLGGAFFFLWLRRGALRLGIWPSLLGGAAFMLDGYLVAKAQYPNMLQALAWAPLILLLAERLTQARNAQTALLLGAALGLQLLAAHAQVTLYTVYLALGLAVFRLWGQARRAWLRSAGWGLFSLLVGLGLSCGQWLPVVDARRLAARQTLSLFHVNRLRLPWAEMTDFILPFRFGSPLRGDWSGAGPVWETACYAGLVTVVLALAALVSAWRLPRLRRETAWWAGVFTLSVWLALGADGGLFRLAYAFVPGMKLFHDPARLLLGTAVALPVLGALGLQSLLASPRLARPRRASWAGAACLGLLALDMAPYDRGLYPTQPVAVLEDPAGASAVLRAVRADPALATHAGRVLTMDDEAASTEFQAWTDYKAQMPGYVPRLAQTLIPNLPVLAGLSNAGGYEPLMLARSAALGGLAVQSLRAPAFGPLPRTLPPAQIAPLLAWMSVRTVVAYRAQPPPSVPGLVPTLTWADGDAAHHGFVRANALWLPRARVYAAWRAASAGGPLSLSPDALAAPHVEGPASASAAVPTAPVAAVLTRDDPDFVDIALPPAPSSRPRLLVLADTHTPGWAARVDNRPVPLLRANGVFRAVVVPATARRVTFSYQPVSVRLGLYVSLLTVALLVAGGVRFARKEPR